MLRLWRRPPSHCQLSVVSQCSTISWIESHNALHDGQTEETQNPPDLTILIKIYVFKESFVCCTQECTGCNTAGHLFARIRPRRLVILWHLYFKLSAFNNFQFKYFARLKTVQPPSYYHLQCGSTVYQVFLLYSITRHFYLLLEELKMTHPKTTTKSLGLSSKGLLISRMANN